MELLEALVESAVETHPDYYKLDYFISDVWSTFEVNDVLKNAIQS